MDFLKRIKEMGNSSQAMKAILLNFEDYLISGQKFGTERIISHNYPFKGLLPVVIIPMKIEKGARQALYKIIIILKVLSIIEKR
ncbi:hypothetical protein [Peribacillus sp. NPDC097895]|uniref:hypothetical protein n=1 Tax=Peribacillus sp. NPDC097895 TaxID=3390619 RepID=UPI003D07D944